MPVDLRSDTVTRPTPAMYQAMASAPVGDDVLGDDPTVMELEREAAALVGKEAGLFVPSGTMGNLVALSTHTKPGDSVLFEDQAHIVYYEGGSLAITSSVVARSMVTQDGVVHPSQVKSGILTRSHHTPGTSLVCLENTHNRHGGSVTPVERHKEIAEAAWERGVKVHLDGARLFNASTALGVQAKEICQWVDSVTFCLSKGLCCPVGSVLCGTEDFIDQARYWRKRMGGGMRQSGILAACGLVALRTLVDRLAEDHDRTKHLGEACRNIPGLDPLPSPTNILIVRTQDSAKKWEDALAAQGVWTIALDEYRLRAVFHHDVDDAGLEQAIQAFSRVKL